MRKDKSREIKKPKKKRVLCRDCRHKDEQMGIFDPIELYCKELGKKVLSSGSCYRGEHHEKRG